MTGLAQAIILLWGWRRRAVAFLAGAASILSQAPFHLAPVLFLTLPVLVLLLDGATSPARGLRRLLPAAAVGWWFGFGYHLAGLWWVGAAFLVEADAFGWMMPFAVLILPAGLALFTALGAVAARLLWVESPLRVLSLAMGLTAAEWLRGHVATGFPWNLIGQAVAFSDVTAQAASVVGVYGLTALGIVVFAAPAVLADTSRARPVARAAVLGLAVAIAGVVVGFGAVRLSAAPPAGSDMTPGLAVRIVQPAIDQARKWSPEFREETLGTLERLTDLKTSPETLGAMSFTHVIWPETALPFFLTEEPEALARLAALLPTGTTLIAGAPRLELAGDGRRFYNAAYVVDDQGRILAAYDKAHLVPFGEYLPFADLLSRLGLRQLAKGAGAFSAGPGAATLPIGGGLRAGILICYEIIFSGAVTAGDRPDLLLNLTNDAWFGRTTGPYQHLDQARLRAVEEGVPVLRAANTGISAVIDAYGRILSQTELGAEAVLDSGLPDRRPAVLFPRAERHFLLTFYVVSFILVAAGGRKLTWMR